MCSLKEEHKTAYYIISNKGLVSLAKYRPESKEDLSVYTDWEKQLIIHKDSSSFLL